MAARLLLFGPPASGKGTQADVLSENLGIPQVATGNILRAEVALRSALGLRARGYMDSGDLVPDTLMIDIIRARLRHRDCEYGFLLDGFPRTVPQAEALDGLFFSIGIRLDCVLYLHVPEEDLVRRVAGRLTCPICSRSYAFEPERPKPEECLSDGGLLFVRDDDRPETVRRRIAVYRENTVPVLEHYRAQSLVVEIDGTGAVPAVSARLLAAVPRQAAPIPAGVSLRGLDSL